MDCFERGYDSSTILEPGCVKISSGDVTKVIKNLSQNHHENSTPTSRGRKYFIGDETIEHSIGPQPVLLVESPTEEGLTAIAEEFELPL